MTRADPDPKRLNQNLEAARGVTAAGGRMPHLRWRPLRGNLIDRRGAALALPILLVAGLNVAAVTGLADIAGFRAVYTALTRFVAVAVRGGGRAGGVGDRLLPRLPADLRRRGRP